jgi:hypothetical protein
MRGMYLVWEECIWCERNVIGVRGCANVWLSTIELGTVSTYVVRKGKKAVSIYVVRRDGIHVRKKDSEHVFLYGSFNRRRNTDF